MRSTFLPFSLCCPITRAEKTQTKSTAFAKQILLQMRWLDHLHDSEAIARKLLETFQFVGDTFKKEIIGVLPQIVDDRGAFVCLLFSLSSHQIDSHCLTLGMVVAV